MFLSARPRVERLTKSLARLRVAYPQQRQTQRTLTDLAERQKQITSKYTDKLHERIKKEGVTDVAELKAKVLTKAKPPDQPLPKDNASTSKMTPQQPPYTSVRKDSSPVKPLADFMDVRKILAANHTAEQVSNLWTTYHATRSQGTGRGYLSATIPLETYVKMTSVATKYPSFLLPLPRPSPEETQKVAHEFHFLQWGFHDVPPHPSQTLSLPFEDQLTTPPGSAEPNPVCSTVLFTPLQEYKLRQTFAQPYLVLTHYTDLATTHGIILMRGELTSSPSSAQKYLLSQADAQLLALGVQRFYLGTRDDCSARRAELLRKFHEVPAEFQWEELLAFVDPTA